MTEKCEISKRFRTYKALFEIERPDKIIPQKKKTFNLTELSLALDLIHMEKKRNELLATYAICRGMYETPTISTLTIIIVEL